MRNNYMTEGSKYIACPFFYDNKLIGYIGAFYNEPDVKGITPIVLNKFQYITSRIENTLDLYRL